MAALEYLRPMECCERQWYSADIQHNVLREPTSVRGLLRHGQSYLFKQ